MAILRWYLMFSVNSPSPVKQASVDNTLQTRLTFGSKVYLAYQMPHAWCEKQWVPTILLEKKICDI